MENLFFIVNLLESISQDYPYVIDLGEKILLKFLSWYLPKLKKEKGDERNKKSPSSNN